MKISIIILLSLLFSIYEFKVAPPQKSGSLKVKAKTAVIKPNIPPASSKKNPASEKNLKKNDSKPIQNDQMGVKFESTDKTGTKYRTTLWMAKVNGTLKITGGVQERI
ncbi:unnamed protein product [Caenorhabditis angaria]|uniref:Uncharacterized protein n=1 Tax=Caenorhabditis angaria TaxID=860376 RepID=A0A9P1N3E0_9PELO|nr:unnamed protein product [Caenorhabditis angaria]